MGDPKKEIEILMKRFVLYVAMVILCASVEPSSNLAKVPPIEQTKDKPTLPRRDRDGGAQDAIPDLKQSGTILFSSSQSGSQDIYSLDLATGRQTNLTNNRFDDGYPRFSPDGKKIAFATNRDGSWEIYVMNRDGSDQRNITRNKDGNGYMDWSPDGQSLVFASTRYGDRNNDIYSIRADGSGLRRITNDPSEDVHPVWSPDGEHIAFASERDGGRQLYLWNSNDGSIDRLTDSGSYDDYPAWSPDGTRIAFASGRGSGSSSKLDIYIATLERATRWMNIEGKRTKVSMVGHLSAASVSRVVAHPSDDRHPTWSPDGKMLAFVSDRDGDRDIFVMKADGTGLQKVVAAKGNDEHPHWNAYSQVSQEPAGEDSFKRRPTLKRRKEEDPDSTPKPATNPPKRVVSTNDIGTFPPHLTPQQVAEAIFDRLLTRCGTSYFVLVFRGGTELNELKGRRTVIVEGGPVTPKPLTQAEILNGKKPSKMEWMGQAYLRYESSRFWKGQEWSIWSSNSVIGPYVFFHKEAGVWKVTGSTGSSMTGTDCNSIPSTVRPTGGGGIYAFNLYSKGIRQDLLDKLYFHSKTGQGFDLSFGPNNSWVILCNGLYSANNEPPGLREDIQGDLGNVRNIILSPNGGWITFRYNEFHFNGIASETRDLLSKIYRDAEENRLEIARPSLSFSENGGFVFLYDIGTPFEKSHNYYYNNVPQSLVQTLKELYTNGRGADEVSLGPNGSWLMRYDRNGFKYEGLSDDIVTILNTINRQGKRFSVYFSPGGGYLIQPY